MSCEPQIEYHDETLDGHPAVPLDATVCASAASLVPSAPRVEPQVQRGNVIEMPARLAMKPKPSYEELCRRITRVSDAEKRRLANLLIEGKPFAKRGSREPTLQKITSSVAFCAPESTVDDLAKLFEASIAAMAAEENDPANPALTMDQVREKLGKALARRHAAYVQERALIGKGFAGLSSPKSDAAAAPSSATSSDSAASASMESDTYGVDRQEPYSDDEVAGFARSQKCKRSEWPQRWAIQRENSYYVWTEDGYRSALTDKSVMSSLKRDLAPAVNGNHVDLWIQKADGGVRRRTLPEVIEAHGTVARDTHVDLGLPRSYYDPHTQVFHEAACPVRSDLEPTFTPEIDQWLKLLAGEEYDRLLDWIATVTVLERQTAALLMTGRSGSGKGMLACGLAKIWGPDVSPTEIGRILDNWNADLMRCPLIFADEHVPGKRRSADLRALIGSNSRTLTRKFMPNASMNGAIRLILAANNDKLLGIADEDLTADDLDAIGSRFIHIEIGKAPAKYLIDLGGRTATANWVEGDALIARHALWLRENRKVRPGDRFLVAGRTSKMAYKMATRAPAAEAAVEWIVGYLMNPKLSDQQHRGLMHVGNGEILATVDALRLGWNHYIESSRLPRTAELGRAISNLSTGSKLLGPEGSQRQYYTVRPDLVLGWAQDQGIGDVRAMAKMIARDTTRLQVVQPEQDVSPDANKGPASSADPSHKDKSR